MAASSQDLILRPHLPKAHVAPESPWTKCDPTPKNKVEVTNSLGVIFMGFSEWKIATVNSR